jgi:hypothetical protein
LGPRNGTSKAGKIFQINGITKNCENFDEDDSDEELEELNELTEGSHKAVRTLLLLLLLLPQMKRKLKLNFATEEKQVQQLSIISLDSQMVSINQLFLISHLNPLHLQYFFINMLPPLMKPVLQHRSLISQWRKCTDFLPS